MHRYQRTMLVVRLYETFCLHRARWWMQKPPQMIPQENMDMHNPYKQQQGGYPHHQQVRLARGLITIFHRVLSSLTVYLSPSSSMRVRTTDRYLSRSKG